MGGVENQLREQDLVGAFVDLGHLSDMQLRQSCWERDYHEPAHLEEGPVKLVLSTVQLMW